MALCVIAGIRSDIPTKGSCFSWCSGSGCNEGSFRRFQSVLQGGVKPCEELSFSSCSVQCHPHSARAITTQPYCRSRCGAYREGNSCRAPCEHEHTGHRNGTMDACTFGAMGSSKSLVENNFGGSFGEPNRAFLEALPATIPVFVKLVFSLVP